MDKNMKIPNHIAFIMDGNGRWAKKRLLPRKVGHREGVKALQRVVDICRDFNIKAVSFYAFSTENWSRPQDEIEALFGMVKKFADEELPRYAKDNYIVKFMGDITALPSDVKESLDRIANDVKNNTGMIVNIGLNYGGRDEIVMAANKVLTDGLPLTKENIDKYLYTAGIGDPDIIVRSSGEQRLSNFMLWQSAYSELIFRKELWPDFDKNVIESILTEYSSRDRRFGKVGKNG